MRGNQEAVYYRALVKKDRRYDGRVYFGVRTTGIFCRPICPARTPYRKNVAFYPSAAAAQAAGFRPCLRCRPETLPGTPAWSGTSATVSRALRFIQNGALDRESLPELADRMGLTDRHLRRLFEKHLGSSPREIALGRRLDLSRQLVVTTRLPVSDIAFRAGFRSLRRFNDAFKKRFLRAPTQLRKGVQS
jgi:AraC family transcriptional regulator, regulatory protein of adaptative response / DNA-3-methyladenine glycosylase II